MKETVVIGMSGGVDSSVAAYLLKQQGYNVIGLFMRNWEEADDSGHCNAEQDFTDVRLVCDKLEIPYFSVNFAKEYQENVFKYFLKEYELGRTPNPDVLCNKEIKFKEFLNFAKKLGADKIATGHYCDVAEIDGLFYLKKPLDNNKDQTYFLNQLSQEQLKDVMFPLANLSKPQVREIAQREGLSTAVKKDSTGICFIGERKFRDFLSAYLPNCEGLIKTLDGKIVGKHLGLMYYTLGQRRGLGIGGVDDGNNNRWFVVEKDMKNNILIVSHGDESPLLSKSLISYDINWIPKIPDIYNSDIYAKFRYRQGEQKVSVKILTNSVEVVFNERQRAVTPGQYVVFYDKLYCLGGGVIEAVTK